MSTAGLTIVIRNILKRLPYLAALLLCLAAPVLGAASGARAETGAAPVTPCGGEIACELRAGRYYVHMPEPGHEAASKRQPGGRVGAIVFLHGHRGNGLNEIRNRSFQALADDLGVAFVAVEGLQGTWSFPNAPHALRDEPAFFDAVLADLTGRFPVDRSKILLSGFSSGAFMTWALACQQPDRFAGYAPIAGAFWEPLPDHCAGPAPYLYHTHGTTDEVVPLAGRYLGGGRFKQGDVYESLKVWLRAEGRSLDRGESHGEPGLSCTSWAMASGRLELCLHDGGHSVRAEWLKRAWRNLERDRGLTRPAASAPASACAPDGVGAAAPSRSSAC